VVLYALYVHCTRVRLSYVINFYLLTYLLIYLLTYLTGLLGFYPRRLKAPQIAMGTTDHSEGEVYNTAEEQTLQT